MHLPVGVDSQHVFFSLAIAWNDGATAYACVAPRTFGGQPNPGVSGGATQFWRTQDRGATWTRLPDPPVDRQDITACSIAVDQIIPDQVLLSVTWQRNPTTLDESQAATYASADSGATWRRLPDPSTVEISTTATYQGTVYAERGSWGIYATKPAHPGLVASTDGMRTWHAVDGAITAAGESDNSYWLRPDTGELLAEASNVNFSGTNLPSSSTLPVEDLWDSTDDGVHWTKLAVPDLSHGNPTSSSLPVNFNVAQPVVGHPFAICANTYMYYGKPEQFGNLTCSDDGGKTWRERPMLFAAASELPGTPQSAGGPQRMEYLFAMTESGAVLGYTTYSNNLLYRLLPGRTEWQSLGTLPSLNFTPEYFPSPSGDVFWALPAVERPANFASSFSFYDSHDVVYIATYPPEA